MNDNPVILEPAEPLNYDQGSYEDCFYTSAKEAAKKLGLDGKHTGTGAPNPEGESDAY